MRMSIVNYWVNSNVNSIPIDGILGSTAPWQTKAELVGFCGGETSFAFGDSHASQVAISEIYPDNNSQIYHDISDATVANSFGYLSDVEWSKNYSFTVNKYQMNANWIKSHTHRLCDGDWIGLQNPEELKQHPTVRLPDDLLLKTPDVLGLSFSVDRSASLTSTTAAAASPTSDAAAIIARSHTTKMASSSQWVAVQPQPPYSSLGFSFDGSAQQNNNNNNDRSGGGELCDDSSSIVTCDDLNYGFGYDTRIYEECQAELCGEPVAYRQNFIDFNLGSQTATDLVPPYDDGDAYHQRGRLGSVPSFCAASRTAVVAPITATGNHPSTGKRHPGPAVAVGESLGSQSIRGFHLSNVDKVNSSSRCYVADQNIASAYRCIPSVGMLQSGGRVLAPTGRTLEGQTMRKNCRKNEAFGRDN